MFETLIKINCFSKRKIVRSFAANLLEKLYGCEINCTEIDKTVLFAHHARGCTVIAAKICENVVIYQNVTIGSNMRYNKTDKKWENAGVPIIGKNTIIADGAKILGAIIIGENCVIGAGAIITQDIPANMIAFGVNQFKPKDPNYDLIFNRDMITTDKIIAANKQLIARYQAQGTHERLQ